MFLSQSSPPNYYRQVSASNLTISSLVDGVWFWTIRAANHYYPRDASEVLSFEVPFLCALILQNLQICNPSRPTTPKIVSPENGDYVSDTTFNLSYYGTDVWGTSCSPVISHPLYQVENYNSLFLKE